MAEPNRPDVIPAVDGENKLQSEEIMRRRIFGGLLRRAPRSLLTLIYEESVPPSGFHEERFPEKGYRPQGRTLDTVKSVLAESKIAARMDANLGTVAQTDDIVDMMGQNRIGYMPTQLEGEDLIQVVTGEGFIFDSSRLGADKLVRANKEALAKFDGLEADRLLIALYAEGCSSEASRGGHVDLGGEIKVRYPNKGGTVTVFNMYKSEGGSLTHRIEDVFVAKTGRI